MYNTALQSLINLSFTVQLPEATISIVDFTSTSISVAWGVVTDPAVTQYQLVATPIIDGQSGTPIPAFYPAIASPRHTFVGLTPGTLYQVGF